MVEFVERGKNREITISDFELCSVFFLFTRHVDSDYTQ
jgi:hypothetical protein